MHQLLATVLAFSLALVDITGTWQLKVTWVPYDPGMPTLVLKQEGTNVTGTYRGGMGTFKVKGKIAGKEMDLDVELTPEFQKKRPEIGLIHFVGTISENGRSITGKAETKKVKGTFTGSKQ